MCTPVLIISLKLVLHGRVVTTFTAQLTGHTHKLTHKIAEFFVVSLGLCNAMIASVRIGCKVYQLSPASMSHILRRILYREKRMCCFILHSNVNKNCRVFGARIFLCGGTDHCSFISCRHHQQRLENHERNLTRPYGLLAGPTGAILATINLQATEITMPRRRCIGDR
jgi:hypothetical protein